VLSLLVLIHQFDMLFCYR